MKPRKSKLYEQWVKHDDLPRETVQQKDIKKDIKKDSSGDKPVGKEKNAQRLRDLYMLVGLGIVIFIFLVAVILILVQYY